MSMKSITCLVAMFGLLTAGAAWGQENIPYADPSSRESRRESRRTGGSNGTGVTMQPFNPYGGLNSGGRGSNNATGTPKAGSTPAAKTDPRAKTVTSSKATATTGTVAKRPGGPGAPGAPGAPGKGAAPGGSFAQVGQVKEVTKEMVQSGRTRKVKFNAATAADDSGIILLNPRKLDTLD